PAQAAGAPRHRPRMERRRRLPRGNDPRMKNVLLTKRRSRLVGVAERDRPERPGQRPGPLGGTPLDLTQLQQRPRRRGPGPLAAAAAKRHRVGPTQADRTPGVGQPGDVLPDRDAGPRLYPAIVGEWEGLLPDQAQLAPGRVAFAGRVLLLLQAHG